MYSRIVSAQIQPGRMDELANIFEHSVTPLLKKVPGFISISLLEDRDTNKAVFIGMYESVAAMKSIEANGFYQEQMAKFAVCMSCPPTREFYEVRSTVTSSS